MTSPGHHGMSQHGMKLTLKVWRQAGPGATGEFRDYRLENISPDISFLEMLDILNEQLIARNEEPIAFDHDCREGICGTCGVMINGQPHGPDNTTTTCQFSEWGTRRSWSHVRGGDIREYDGRESYAMYATERSVKCMGTS